jgi:hypothetical protein
MKTENKFLCDCGHYENQEDIYGVANYSNTHVFDLCENCWKESDLIIDDKEVLATWKFNDKEGQNTIVATKKIEAIINL